MSSITKKSFQKVAAQMGTRRRALGLGGVPHWVTPGDIRRMAERSGVTGIVDVRIESDQGIQTGNAFIEFETGHLTRKASTLLAGSQVSGIPITVTGFEHALSARNKKNYIMDPSRPLTGAKSPATTVIYGFPSRYEVKDVREFLHDYRLSLFGTPNEAYEKVFESQGTSRWAIHLQSYSDAWRLVRHLHMKRFHLTSRGESLLAARVLH